MTTRVLLVDDHAIVRRGLRAILEDGLGPLDVVEAADADEALAALDQELDAIVLDLSLPGRGGLDLISELKHRRPRVPILIVSIHPEAHYAVRALRAGAAGYLTKDAAPDELVTALEKVLANGRFISDALAERLAEMVTQRPTEAPHELLSEREFDVLRGLAAGKTIGQLAAEMHLSVKTVSTYRTRLLEKMGLGSNAELTRYALEHSLV